MLKSLVLPSPKLLGAFTAGNVPIFDANGNLIDSGSTPGGGGGGGDFVLIGEITCGGSSATETFSAIPGTYLHLKLVFTGRVTSAGSANHAIYAQFNGDTGANYDRQEVFGAATTDGAAESVATATPALFSAPEASAQANACGSGEVLLPYYSQTTFYKTAIGTITSKNTNSSGGVVEVSRAVHWRNTAAITSILVGVATSGNFAAGSKFSLYGIAANGSSMNPGRLIGVQVITATGAGTYTPTTGTASIVMELIGGGGGGGGSATPGGGLAIASRGGGAGGYVRKRLTAAFSGASYSVGAGGTGGAAGANNGNAGGDTTFTATGGGGTVYTASGGSGGNTGTATAPPFIGVQTAGGGATNGDVNRPGNPSVSGVAMSTSNAMSGGGGAGPYGPGAAGVNVSVVDTSTAGVNATGKGGGGSGAVGVGTGATRAGGDGSAGLLIIWEYS